MVIKKKKSATKSRLNVPEVRRLIRALKTKIPPPIGGVTDFNMTRYAQTVVDSGDNVCGTAVCLAGLEAALLGYALPLSKLMVVGDSFFTHSPRLAAMEALGLTDEQATQLFTPCHLESRRMTIKLKDDIWGNVNYPIRLSGARGKLIAIHALERVIKLWR